MSFQSEKNLLDYISSELSRMIAAYHFPTDVYMLQLYPDDQSDPRFKTVDLYFNTIAQVTASSPAPGRPRGFPIASSEREARWNFAFGLQVSAGQLFGEHDLKGRKLKESWLRDNDWWYSDEEKEAEFDAVFPKMEQMDAAFWRLVGQAGRALHDKGVIEGKFGRPVPVLVIELEFSEQAVEATRLANPEPLIDDFLRTIDSYKEKARRDPRRV